MERPARCVAPTRGCRAPPRPAGVVGPPGGVPRSAGRRAVSAVSVSMSAPTPRRETRSQTAPRRKVTRLVDQRAPRAGYAKL